MPAPAKAAPPVQTTRSERAPAFSEKQAWAPVGAGWRQLHGSYHELGFSFEWHDFTTQKIVDWGRSFHPGSIEICLNLDGRGLVTDGAKEMIFAPLTAGFYRQGASKLAARREPSGRHQFLTVELSPEFLRAHLTPDDANLHPMAREVLEGGESVFMSEVIRLTAEQQQAVSSLRHPPVFASAQRLWYRAKTLEVMAAFLYSAPAGKEFFCQRQQRVSQDRVDRVIAILKKNFAEPPTLEALGTQVGCSSFYLSRIFSQQMGKTISQYLRQLRMERAAELLRESKLNVTQVAMEVGYSSSSHFSTAFHETFGCCPGLYPLATPAQLSRREP